MLTRIIHELLSRTEGDAVLIFEGMYASLLRKNGNLSIDTTYYSLWNDNTLGIFTEGYETADLSHYH